MPHMVKDEASILKSELGSEIFKQEMSMKCEQDLVGSQNMEGNPENLNEHFPFRQNQNGQQASYLGPGPFE